MVSKERIFEILEKGRANDPMSIGCDVFLSVLIIINVIAVCLETVEALNTAYRSTFQFIEIVSVIIFSVEYGLRTWSPVTIDISPNSSPSPSRASTIPCLE